MEARFQELSNQLQRLAAVTIDSEWLKILVSLGTQAVKIIADLAEKIGSIPLLIGTASGAISTLLGKGIFDAKSLAKGQNPFAGVTNLSKTIGGMISAKRHGQAIQKEIFTPSTDQ